MLRFCLLLLAISLSVLRVDAAEDFSPIPPSVWAIKSGLKGAVVLEDKLRFGTRLTEYEYRVRIFSEEGRHAAEISDLPSSAIDLRGRTSYPDGRVVQFNRRQDFATRTIEMNSGSIRRIHLVAPGVTSDCVVEIKWAEWSDGIFRGIPKRFNNGLYGRWHLGNSYPTQVATVEFSLPFPLATTFAPYNKGRLEDRTTGLFRILTFRDLPAVDEPVYSIVSNNGFPKFEIFYQPEMIVDKVSKGPDTYWSAAASHIFKREYESDVDKGSGFSGFVQELLLGLPTETVARAVGLLNRLDGRIKNVSRPTFTEEAELPKDFWAEFKYKRLDKAIKSGLTNNQGMRLLFFQALKVAGLSPKVGLVVNRKEATFQFNKPNPWQFDGELIGVESPGIGIVWFDTDLRHATPGTINPDFEGTPMLCLDPSQDWKVSRMTLGAIAHTHNVRAFGYTLTLDDDSDRVEIRSEFRGYPEYVERSSYRGLEPSGMSKALKDRYERSMKNATIQKADVFNVLDFSKGVFWSVSATLEREPGRRREVTPFPGMPWPLSVPDALDTYRRVPIVLPLLFTQTAESEFETPKGYRWLSVDAFQKENEFGKVSWVPTYNSETRKVKVAFRTEVVTLSAPADHWNAFKDFLEWIQEACRRQIVLEKES